MKSEVELKYAVTNFTDFTEKLRALGAILVQPAAAEKNTVYDNGEGSLQSSGRLLRLRSYAGRIILTVKEPCLSSPMKHRIEHEADLLTDYAHADALLKALGYTPVYTYRKTREEWIFQGTHVCLDSLDFGSFVEVEGETPDAVLSMSQLLGFNPDNGLRESYRDLEQSLTGKGNQPIS